MHSVPEASGEVADGEVDDAKGDDRWLRSVYREHATIVFGIARRVTGDRDIAEDITQDVFSALWWKFGSYDGSKGSLRSYLCMTAHARAVDVVRSERARAVRHVRHDTDVTFLRAVRDEVGDDFVDADENERRRAATIRAVQGLSAAHREVIELAYYDGHTYREVARLLGIPEGTAKSRLRAALAQLSVAPGLRPS